MTQPARHEALERLDIFAGEWALEASFPGDTSTAAQGPPPRSGTAAKRALGYAACLSGPSMDGSCLLRELRLCGVLLGLLTGRGAFAQHHGETRGKHRHLQLAGAHRRRPGRLHAGPRPRSDRRRTRPRNRGLLSPFTRIRRRRVDARGRTDRGGTPPLPGDGARPLDPRQRRPPRSPDRSPHKPARARTHVEALITGSIPVTTFAAPPAWTLAERADRGDRSRPGGVCERRSITTTRGAT